MNTPEKPGRLFRETIWLVIIVCFVLGFVFLAAVSIEGALGNEKHFWKYYAITLGTAMLTGCACFGIGAMCGFLFGIPRIINATPTKNPVKAVSGTVLHNDNLVQISDWLTKILVGVGLTQAGKISRYLGEIGKTLGPCFQSRPGNDLSGSAIAICAVLYFTILGFMACYLWTRFHFSEMLKDSLEENDFPQEGATSIQNESQTNINIKV